MWFPAGPLGLLSIVCFLAAAFGDDPTADTHIAAPTTDFLSSDMVDQKTVDVLSEGLMAHNNILSEPDDFLRATLSASGIEIRSNDHTTPSLDGIIDLTVPSLEGEYSKDVSSDEFKSLENERVRDEADHESDTTTTVDKEKDDIVLIDHEAAEVVASRGQQEEVSDDGNEERGSAEQEITSFELNESNEVYEDRSTEEIVSDSINYTAEHEIISSELNELIEDNDSEETTSDTDEKEADQEITQLELNEVSDATEVNEINEGHGENEENKVNDESEVNEDKSDEILASSSIHNEAQHDVISEGENTLNSDEINEDITLEHFASVDEGLSHDLSDKIIDINSISKSTPYSDELQMELFSCRSTLATTEISLRSMIQSLQEEIALEKENTLAYISDLENKLHSCAAGQTILHTVQEIDIHKSLKENPVQRVIMEDTTSSKLLSTTPSIVLEDSQKESQNYSEKDSKENILNHSLDKFQENSEEHSEENLEADKKGATQGFSHVHKNIVMPYYADYMMPFLISFCGTYVTPALGMFVHVTTRTCATVVPIAHKGLESSKLFYFSTVHPPLQSAYVTHIESNWNNIVVPPYKTHVEPHVSGGLLGARTMYNKYLHEFVALYLEPIFDFVWSKLNRGAYNIYRFCDSEDILENISELFGSVFGSFEFLVTKIESNKLTKNIFGSHSHNVVTGIILISILIILTLFRKIILGVLAACLFVILIPLLPVVYVFSKIRKLFSSKTKSQRNKGKSSGSSKKKDINPEHSAPTYVEKNNFEKNNLNNSNNSPFQGSGMNNNNYNENNASNNNINSNNSNNNTNNNSSNNSSRNENYSSHNNTYNNDSYNNSQNNNNNSNNNNDNINNDNSNYNNDNIRSNNNFSAYNDNNSYNTGSSQGQVQGQVQGQGLTQGQGQGQGPPMMTPHLRRSVQAQGQGQGQGQGPTYPPSQNQSQSQMPRPYKTHVATYADVNSNRNQNQFQNQGQGPQYSQYDENA